MRINLPVVGEAYQTRWEPFAAQRCVNLFLTAAPGGQPALFNTPGTQRWADLGVSKRVRGMHLFSDKIYAIAGDTLYQIDQSGYATAVDSGSLPAAGTISMADNGTEMAIADGADGWTYDGATLSKIADADFRATTSVAFMDGYFIWTENDSGRFFLSDLYDGRTYDPVQFATAESSPDDLTTVLVDNRELWLFGERSTEVWWNAGETFPFSRIPGATMNIGLAALESPASINNTVFWLGNDRLVYRADAYQPVNVANDGVAHAFEGYDSVSDAIGYTYEEEGNYFYVISFPSADATWVYCINTNKWHERQSISPGRNISNYAVFAWNKVLVSDYRENGLIHELSLDYPTDNGHRIIRKRSTTAYTSDGKFTFWGKVGIECNSGNSAQGEVPQVMFRYSDDGGRTWGNEIWQPFGKVGDYRTRVEYGPLGRSLNRAYEFSITHTGPFSITAGYAEVDLG